MTLDEAIKHAYAVANSKCDSCGTEHRQLANWLDELKELKYEIQYIRNVVLPIANEKERKDRLECVAERLVKMYEV